YDVVDTFKCTDFDRMTVKHQLYDKSSLVINDTYVTAEDGTGLVHNATGFGEYDYNVGKKYCLPVYSPIDYQGRYTKDIP
ncbi:class I tRNA ligase family protein, partial [Lactobacillus jensenii]|uniref:class I tRNA ligase family protein n=1 Tax=Lactobacillus jensenii TaxID=109790 RepID=UPI0028703D04